MLTNLDKINIIEQDYITPHIILVIYLYVLFH